MKTKKGEINFMIGTDSESLANKEGKLEETNIYIYINIYKITSVSMRLFRNDRDKMPSIFRRCSARELEGEMRKTVNCTAAIQTSILGKIFFYRHHLSSISSR